MHVAYTSSIIGWLKTATIVSKPSGWEVTINATVASAEYPDLFEFMKRIRGKPVEALTWSFYEYYPMGLIKLIAAQVKDGTIDVPDSMFSYKPIPTNLILRMLQRIPVAKEESRLLVIDAGCGEVLDEFLKIGRHVIDGGEYWFFYHDTRPFYQQVMNAKLYTFTPPDTAYDVILLGALDNQNATRALAALPWLKKSGVIIGVAPLYRTEVRKFACTEEPITGNLNLYVIKIPPTQRIEPKKLSLPLHDDLQQHPKHQQQQLGLFA